MQFKEWIELKESIIVKDHNDDATLRVAEADKIKEFNYQDDKHWSNFLIIPYHATRIGYVSVGTHPTHIGITKTTPIEAGKGVDVNFIKTLNGLLSRIGPPVPYREGESEWSNMLKDRPEHQDIKDKFQAAAEKTNSVKAPPEIKLGSSNMQKITNGMSVSKASGSWSYFIKTEHASYMIPKIIEAMKLAAKPLIDNDFIEFYEIVNRATGNREEIVHSKSGKSGEDAYKDNWNKCAAQIKFLADLMLKNYPEANKLIHNTMNMVGRNVRGGKWPAVDVQPANFKLPIETLEKFVHSSYADEIILMFFLKAVKKDDVRKYDIINKAAKYKNVGSVLYYLDKLIDDNGEKIVDQAEDGSFYEAINLLQNSKEIEELAGTEYNRFLTKLEPAVNEYIKNNASDLSKSDIKNIQTLSKYITIDSQILQQVDQLHKKITDDEQAKELDRKTKAENAKFLIYDGNWKYCTKDEPIWENIPDKYISYHDSVDLAEFIEGEGIVDFSEIHEDAYDKAMEEVMGNAEERPSETYGDDKEEVLSDIGYDMDDFVNDESIDVPEDISDEDLEKLIADQYYDQYLEWKIKKLKEEEEEESWKYEPEPDNEDIRKAAEDLFVEVAFNEKGLVTLNANYEKNRVDVEYESKFEPKMMPQLKRAVAASLKAKDEDDEPVMKRYVKISLEPRDKPGRIIPAEELVRS